jgi:signal transduction histidine kinase
MKRIGMGVITVAIISLTIVLLYAYSRSKPVPASHQVYEDFSFRSIQGLIGDSALYFPAIDSVFSHLRDGHRQYEIYSCKRGYFYTEKRNFQKSLLYSDSILSVLKRYKDDPGYWFWYSTALFKKGDDLHALRRYSEAFTFYFRAREAIQKTGDHCLYNDYSNRLGMVAYQAENYREAAGYFKHAVEEMTRCEMLDSSHRANRDFSGTQSNLDNIGLCYSKLGMTDSALHYFDSALNYIDRYSHYAFRFNANNVRVQDTAFIETATAVIYGNKAKDLIITGRESEAESLLIESIRLNRLPQHALDDVPYSLAKLADLYIKQSRLTEAERILNELKQGLDTFPNTGILKRWYKAQSVYAERKQDYPASNKFLTQYLVMRDSMEAANPRMPGGDLHSAFESLSNEYELSNLQKEGSLKNLYLLIAGICIAAAATVSWLTWRNFRQSKKYIASLENLNRQIQRKNAHLQHALRALEKSHEENSRMMKIVAHDLRNPIGGIAGISAILLKENNYSATQKDMLQMIQQSSNNSLKLIQDLVQIHVPVSETVKEPVELRDLLGYCIEMLHLKVSEKKQQISLEAVPANVLGDSEKLWRVFSNLISNAIKFSPEKSKINVTLEMKGDEAIVAIRDHGIGIPENLRDKIFSMSPDAKRKGTAGEPSFGLGLAICKQIVEANNGKIWFESEVNKGTSFFVSFSSES